MRTAQSLLRNETGARFFTRSSGHSASITGVAVNLVAFTCLIACGTKTDQSATKEALPPTATAPAITQKEPAPQTLVNVGELGENIYDAAKGGKWSEAQTKLTELKDAMNRSGAILSKSNEQQNKLQGFVASLDTSISKKAESTTMRDANQVTLIVSELMASYQTKVPAEISRLDYDGRELEIWSHAHESAKLKETAADLRQTWDKVKPQVESHNGMAEAQKFSELVKAVESATTSASYQKLASQVLDQVDKLEKVF